MGRSISGDAAASQTKTVFSVDGFQKGDLIYKTASKTGKIPDDFVATASFEASQREINYYRGEDSLYSRKTITSQTPTSQTAMGNGVAAAVLSNGNVVSVYLRSYNNPGTSSEYLDVVFQIDQPDGTSVVSPTVVNQLNSTYRSYENRSLAVASDSSGGFAVFWTGSTSLTGHVQLFDNTGSTVGSVRSLISSTTTIRIKSFNNGTYALAYGNTSNYCYFRTVNSSGLGTQQTVNTNTQYSSNFDLAMDSSGVAHIVYSTSNQILRKSYNSSSTNVISETINSSPMAGSSVLCVAVAVSSSDKIIAVAFGLNATEKLVLYGKDGTSAGGWPSSHVALSWDNSNAPAQHSLLYFESIPSTDNFFYHACGFEWNQAQVIDYLGVAQGPTINNFGSRQNAGARGLILANSELRFYVSGGGRDTNEYRTDGIPLNEVGYVTIDQTNYAGSGENLSSDPVVLASTTANVNGYARGGSTPNTAQFTAASNQTVVGSLPVTTNESTWVGTLTSIGESSNIYYVRGIQLDNGNIAIVYATSTAHHLRVLDKDYQTISTTELATFTTSNWYPKVDITKLANGNIVVVCHEDNNNIPTVRMYDSTMSEITSETVLDTSPTIVATGQHQFCVTQIPYQPTYFLFSWANNATQLYFSIYDSTDMSQVNTATSVDTSRTMAGTQRMIVDKRGIFYAIYRSPPYSEYPLFRGTDNSFPNCTSVGSFNRLNGYGSSSYNRWNGDIIMSADGGLLFPWHNNSGTDGVTSVTGTSSGDWRIGNVGTATTNNYGSLHGTTGNGQYFVLNTTGAGSYPGYIWKGRTTINIDPQAQDQILTNLSSSDQYMGGDIIPADGDTAHVIFRRGTDATHMIGKVRVRPTGYVLKTVQNVTLSAPVTLDEKTSPLLGVAASDCAAGGSGIVQVSGATALNTNYPSGTSEFFDFRSQFSDGVNGLISGRNIELGD